MKILSPVGGCPLDSIIKVHWFPLLHMQDSLEKGNSLITYATGSLHYICRMLAKKVPSSILIRI